MIGGSILNITPSANSSEAFAAIHQPHITAAFVSITGSFIYLLYFILFI
jgi:hypothetical protein